MSLGVAFSQSSTGAVQGIVTDVTGAVLPGVTLTLTNVATRVEKGAETNATGFYSFVAVQPSSYTLTAGLAAFKLAHVPDFVLNVNQVVTQDIVLAVGDVTETVEVEAEAPLLQTATAELGTVVQKDAIRRIPLNGRNFTQLLLLTKGVNPVQTQQGRGQNTGGLLGTSALRGSKFVAPSINGQWNRMNLYLMDGVLNQNPFASSYAILPSLDAVQEFKVQTQNDKGEFGGVLGGVVNLATSSGTSELHGSLFEFLRNETVNARNPFTDIVPDPETGRAMGPGPFRQNQFGGTVGGPIYLPKVYDGRQKTFFFFSYDGWRYRQAASRLYRVPTPEEIGGDFSGPVWSAIFDPATTRADPADPSLLTRTPFPNNVIPAGRIDPMMQSYLQKYFDKPNFSGLPFDNVVNNQPIENDANSWQLRIDHQLSDKTTLFGRYNDFHNSQINPFTLAVRDITDSPRKQAMLALNQLFGSKVVLQLRSSLTRNGILAQADTRPDTATLIQEGWTNVERFGDPIVRIDSIGSSQFRRFFEGPQQTVQYSADLTWLRGRHEFKFGGLYIRNQLRINELNGLTFFGPDQTADPQRLGDTGSSLASTVLGLPATYSAERGDPGVRYTNLGFYAQDSWKINPRLTLSLSLRWDATVPPKYTTVKGGYFDINTGDYLLLGETLPPPCSTSGGPPCIPGDGTLASIQDGEHIRLADRPNFWHPDYNNFGPRIGLAWRFRPRTVLRLGGSIVYDIFSATSQQLTGIALRWPSGSICEAPANGLGDPLTSTGQVVAQCSTAQVDPHPWFTSSGFDPQRKKPESYQYHMEFQHQLADNLSGSIAYVGSLNRRMDYGPRINRALIPGPGSSAEVNARRPFSYMPFSPKYMSDDGTGNYNSLQFELNRRFSNGLMFLVSYTWSKSMDNGSSGFFGSSEAGPTGALQNHFDRRVDRSVSSLHVPHILSVSGTWEIPAGQGRRWLQSGPASWILGNWRLDFIHAMRNGQPWNARLRGDIANVGVTRSYMRPDLVGDPEPGRRTAEQWVRGDAFAIPRFAYGNLGRNTLRTDAVFSSDFALAKEFHITESTRLEFRAESFNLFNVMSYGIPQTFLNQRDFARIRSLAELPRQFQFALKLAF